MSNKLDNNFEMETVKLLPERERVIYENLSADELSIAAELMQSAFQDLLRDDSSLAEVFEKFNVAKAKVAIFGGWARDRLIEYIHKTEMHSRDIDFVIDSDLPIEHFFPKEAEKNPFGGVGIIGTKIPFEAWNLKNTFLFKFENQNGSFDQLPPTADYDINAILFFPYQQNEKALLIDAGAGHAIKHRKIDFMADIVAQPTIQAARAVILATKLGLEPSMAVCDFVQDVCEDRQIARTVEKALERYCPTEFTKGARDLLDLIRRGRAGGRPKSEFFGHCWGVFEGGGVRAAAHAGAYAAAKRAGITFGRVAGTSAGSIVGALVAAGATPSYLRKNLQELDFLTLLEKPKNQNIFFAKRLPFLAKLIGMLTPGKLRSLVDIAKYGGLHDSTKLGDWIENRLIELVRLDGKANKGPVLFSELPIPFHVVATDFSTGKPKIWSPETTSDESVSLAVRHSCTIPLFFQPAPSGASIFFDGGVVSNLPAYILNNRRGNMAERDISPRILAFRLLAEDKGATPVQDLIDFCKRLAATVIDSASEIQLQLQTNVYPIDIHTGAIDSTDFEKLDEKNKRFLYGRGVRDVRNFVANERLNLSRKDTVTQVFQGFDEKMLLLVRQIPSCQKSFLAMGSDTYWLDHVFPSLLLLARRGIPVSIVVPKVNSTKIDSDEKRRRQLLALLGATVIETDEELAFEGFVFDLGSPRACTILAYHSSDESQRNHRYKNEKIRLYTTDSDPAVLGMMTEKTATYTSEVTSKRPNLDYQPCDQQELINRLKTIPAYVNASIILERISVNNKLIVMQKFIKEFKAIQINLMVSDLITSNQNLFTPIQVQLEGNAYSIVTPPVLERHGDSLVVIDGNTRLHHCFVNGIEEIDAVVISNVKEDLPSDGRFNLRSLRLVSSTVSMPDNYKNLNASKYRHIERAVHERYD